MEQELISKKELLQRYGISYGALYRWKRKGLIPEEWFIKKATATGQETFFPQCLICQRVELILNRKEETSLDKLSKRFREETKASIVIKTAVAERMIPLEELVGFVFVDAEGNSSDLTRQIQQLCGAQNHE